MQGAFPGRLLRHIRAMAGRTGLGRARPAWHLLLGCLAAVQAPVPGPGSPALARAAPPPTCGDFLAQARIKPAHLRYAGCERMADQQGKPLRATYRVDGRFAAVTEAHLAKAAGLQRLQRACCVWGAPTRQFRTAGGRTLFITMSSGETVAATRAAWPSIPVFVVFVEVLTEDI